MKKEFDPTAFENCRVSFGTFSDEEGDEENVALESPEHLVGGQTQRGATVFVIDCSESTDRELPRKLFEYHRLLKQNKSEQTVKMEGVAENQAMYFGQSCLWKEAFDSIAKLMRAKITACKFDKIGVLLYGVTDCSFATESLFTGIQQILDLDFISCNGIQLIENLANLSHGGFSRQYQQQKAILPELFWYLKQLFSSKPDCRKYRNEIFLVTANDDPRVSKADEEVAIQRIKDLVEGKIKIEFLLMQPSGVSSSGLSTFFQNVYSEIPELQIYAATKLEGLSQSFRKRVYPQRILSQLTFGISNDIKIGLNLYSYVLQRGLPLPYVLNASDHRPVKCSTRRVCDLTGEILMEEQIKKYFLLDEEEIYIYNEEKQKLNSISSSDEGLPHLHLLGFKPLERLKLNHTIKHQSFLYPNNSKPPCGFKGSSEFCNALIITMVDKNLFALCRYVSRRNSSPRLIALVPKKELQDESDFQIISPGFRLIPLPFADDLRCVELEGYQLTTPGTDLNSKQSRMSLMHQLLKELRLEQFDLFDALNPVLEQFYKGLEALALQQRVVSQVDDSMGIKMSIPKSAIETGLEYLAELENSFGKLKIQRPSLSNRRPSFRQPSTVDIPHFAATGTLASCLVSDLKTYCCSKGLPANGKKADLITRIENYLQQVTPEVQRGIRCPTTMPHIEPSKKSRIH